MSEIITCFSADKSRSEYYALRVSCSENESGELVWESSELLPPMSAEELKKLGAVLPPLASLPDVYKGEDGILHLNVRAYAAMYHPYNPMRVLPYREGFFGTVTVLGCSCREKKGYVKYHMANRVIEILNDHIREYGYFVCDYNGTVAYLSNEQTMSIINRYGTVNAKVSGSGVTAIDGSALPLFAPPGELRGNSARFSAYGDDTIDFDIAKLRLYADTFFVMRRRALRNESDLTQFAESIEAYHQALICGTAPGSVCSKVSAALESMAERLSDDTEYRREERELMMQLRNISFVRTKAFEDMLSCRRDNVDRLAQLNILCDMSGDIVTRYSAIMLAELAMTPLLQELGEELGFVLKGRKNRLKSPGSLYEKLYEQQEDLTLTPEELFRDMTDILRYTVCLDADRYCEGIGQIIRRIVERFPGAQLEKFRNYWTPYVSGQYRGINTVIRMPDVYFDNASRQFVGVQYRGSRRCTPIGSFTFELQFHTENSYKTKKDSHDLYEQIRRRDTDENRRKQIIAEMRELTDRMIEPDGARFLSMMSNEYITSLKNSVQLMERTLDGIRGMADSCFIDKSLLE